jgi:hypothetical protein
LEKPVNRDLLGEAWANSGEELGDADWHWGETWEEPGLASEPGRMSSDLNSETLGRFLPGQV